MGLFGFEKKKENEKKDSSAPKIKGKLMVGVIDGHIDTVTNISNFLEGKGFKTVWAYIPKTAKILSQRKDIDVVVLDTLILKTNNSAEVKELIDGKKVLLLSGRDDTKELSKGLDVIGVSYKPVNLTEIEQILRNYFKIPTSDKKRISVGPQSGSL